MLSQILTESESDSDVAARVAVYLGLPWRGRFPLDHCQDRGEQPAHVGRCQQGTRPGRVLHHDHQAPETIHAGSGPDSPTITNCASILANRKGP